MCVCAGVLTCSQVHLNNFSKSLHTAHAPSSVASTYRLLPSYHFRSSTFAYFRNKRKRQIALNIRLLLSPLLLPRLLLPLLARLARLARLNATPRRLFGYDALLHRHVQYNKNKRVCALNMQFPRCFYCLRFVLRITFSFLLLLLLLFCKQAYVFIIIFPVS